MATTVRDLASTLRDAHRRAEERVTQAEAELVRARRHAEDLGEVASRGDLGPLLDDLDQHFDLLQELVPHLEPRHVRSLLADAPTDHATELVALSLRHAAKTNRVACVDLVVAVASNSRWAGDRRVRVLAADQSDVVHDCLVAAAVTDPRVAVLCGMHLTRRPLGWTGQPGIARLRRRLSQGSTRSYYLLGLAFRSGMSDRELEADLVELLATMPAPELAARMAAELPPVVTDSAAAVARRLADLDMLVAAVLQPAPQQVPSPDEVKP